MPHYALSIYQPDGPRPSDEQLAPVMRKMRALIDDAKAQNVWVFNGGLHAASSATVVRKQNGEVLTTDGPYIEGKEYIGGFLIVDVADLDAALYWAGRMADALADHASGLPVEVRPFAHVGMPR